MTVQSLEPPQAPVQRRRWKRWAALGLIVAAGAGWWLWPRQAAQLSVQGHTVAQRDIVESLRIAGAIEPLGERPIVAEVSGLVTELKVQASDHVKAGQTVALLQDADLMRQLDEAKDALRQLEQGDLVDARFKLQEAERVGVPAARNSAAQARLSQAEAEGELAMKQMLFDAKAESKINLESAKARLEKARLEVAKADNEVKSAELKVVQARGVLALAETKLKAAREKVASLQVKVARLTVRAPEDGLVSRLKVTVGQSVTAGTALYDLADDTKQVVNVEVNELDSVKVKPGMLVKVTTLALPDLELQGRISLITPVAEKLNRRSEYNSIVVKAVLDKVEPRLKAGSTVKSEIILKERRQVPSLAIEAVAADEKGAKWVFQQGPDAKAVKKSIKTGLSGLQYVEITEGLKAGDTVVASLGRPIEEGDPLTIEDKGKKETSERGKRQLGRRR